MSTPEDWWEETETDDVWLDEEEDDADDDQEELDSPDDDISERFTWWTGNEESDEEC